MQFSQFGVAFEVMHAFTLDGQIMQKAENHFILFGAPP